MFSSEVGAQRIPDDPVDQWMWDLVAARGTRVGAVKIEVHLAKPGWGCFGAFHNRYHPTRTIWLTLAEFSEIQKVYGNALASRCKDAVTEGRLYDKVARVWPEGTPEDLALRALVPFAFPLLGVARTRRTWCRCMEYWTWFQPAGLSWAAITLSSKHGPILGMLGQNGGFVTASSDTGKDDVALVRDSAQPTGGASNGAPVQPATGSSSAQSAVIISPQALVPSAPPDQDAPAALADAPAAVVNGLGGDDQDASDTAYWRDNSWVFDGYVNDDATCHRVLARPVSLGQVRSALVMPGVAPPIIHANSNGNVDAAKAGRIDAKQEPPVVSKKLRDSIKQFVHASMHGLSGQGKGKKQQSVKPIFSKKSISKYLDGIGLVDIKSSKWSAKRFESSILCLAQDNGIEFEFQSGIKAEPMPPGKPPRIIVADGDRGQLMALLTIGCFETILFGTFEAQSIKHASKPDAMKRMVSNFSFPAGVRNRIRRQSLMLGSKKSLREELNSVMVEGDGSAWDTTCSAVIRALIEDPVMRHITLIIADLTRICPQEWHYAHLEANEDASLEIRYPKGGFLELNAIRRSGHRGTSCLNWWVNKVMWVCTLAKTPVDYLCAGTITSTSILERPMAMRGCFEGDDSLLHLLGWSKDDLETHVVPVWCAAGFNMKMVYAAADMDRCEFCGWHFLKIGHGFSEYYMPDLKRTIRNMGSSSSVEAAKAAREDDHPKLKAIAVAKALAYAHTYAESAPTFAAKCLEYADGIAVAGFFTYDDRMKLSGGDVIVESELRDSIALQLGVKGGLKEEQMHRLFQLTITEEERDAFQAYRWDFDALKDFDQFKASLPLAWRS